MKRRSIFITGLSLIILLSAGCGVGQTGQTKGGETKPADTAPALLENPRQGLDALDGYHASLVNEFSGTQDGKDQHSRMEMTADMDRGSGALFVQQTQTAGAGRMREMVNGLVGQAAYSRIGDKASRCHVTWSADNQPPSLLPQDILPAVLSADKAGEETVNAVKTVRYTLNPKSLGTDIEDLQGDLWLAEPGAYVVKLDLTYSGGEKTFGKGRIGKQTVRYELTNINTNSSFEWPAGCQPVLAGVPEVPGAKNVNRLPDTLRYTTDSSVEKVTDFYKEHLGTSVWRWGETHTTGAGDSVILFTKVDEPLSLRVLMSESGSGLEVSIVRLKPTVREETADETGGTPQGNPVDPEKAGLPEGVTIYPGARDFTGVEGMRLVFNTPDDAEKVKDFYRSGLKKGGWVVMPGSEGTPDVPMMLNKDGMMLIILAGQGDPDTRVEMIWIKQ